MQRNVYTRPTADDVVISHSAAYEQQGSRMYIVSVATIHGNWKGMSAIMSPYIRAKFRDVTKK